jgi:hypothetical protein
VGRSDLQAGRAVMLVPFAVAAAFHAGTRTGTKGEVAHVDHDLPRGRGGC